MSLKFKKVYVDTKFRTSDSESTSNFSIELPESMLCPDNTVFYVDSVSIPHSWTSVEIGINSKLYFFVFDNTNPSSNISYIAYLTDGNYIGADLAVEMQSKMNTAVFNDWHVNIFTASYNSKNNTIQISTIVPHLSFYILTPNDLQSKLNGLFKLNYDTIKPGDCNELIGNLDAFSKEYNMNTPFVSGYINMQPIRNVYLQSSIGTYQTVAQRPGGYDMTVIKKIPVNADFNEMIFDNVVVVNDWLDCSNQLLKKLDFKLMTSRGDIVPLHGVNMSFSLVFAKANSNF